MSDTQPQLPSSFDGDDDFYNEAIFPKIWRKLKEEPLIPVGIGGTCWALWQASKSIRSGDSYNANRMFRWRLYGQSFTLAAMVVGSLYYNRDRMLRREWFLRQQEVKAKEKHDAWIRELEFREKEDQERRAKMWKVKEAQKREAEGKGSQGVVNAVEALKEKLPSPPSAEEREPSEHAEARVGVVETVKEKLPVRTSIETEKG